jgi:hypothetical protein
MAEKNLVCDGAICMCKFGAAPDKLKVLSQTKDYINEKDPSKKLIASTKEIGGSTFEKNTFGPCKKQPMGSSFKPCQIVVQEWKGFYENAVISNGGKVLLEDSKATCPIGGPDCISITFHGQVAQLSPASVKKAKQEEVQVLYPFGDLMEKQLFHMKK